MNTESMTQENESGAFALARELKAQGQSALNTQARVEATYGHSLACLAVDTAWAK